MRVRQLLLIDNGQMDDNGRMSQRDPDDADRAACAADLARYLNEARDLRRAASADPVFGARRQTLRSFQAARLAQTHADLLANPASAQAAAFFLADLYGPKDLSERDAEVERILPMMTSMLPVSGLQTLLLAVQVDALSERLDAAMVRALGRKLDSGISDADYARAYRKVGERTARLDQIRLIGETGAALDALARKPLLRGLLKIMRGPAEMAGLGELHAFLFRGFEAFRSLTDAESFLDAIVSREGALALAIFDGADALMPAG